MDRPTNAYARGKLSRIIGPRVLPKPVYRDRLAAAVAAVSPQRHWTECHGAPDRFIALQARASEHRATGWALV